MAVLGLGVVGLGRGFMLTLPALRAHPRIKLRGAFDVRSDAGEQFTRDFNAPSHVSLESLLADPLVDALYIASPHELHAEQTLAALEAGKHVLVEKPMAISLSDCAAMDAAARRFGKVLMIGPSHGFDAPVQCAAELVSSGRLGRIRMVTAFNFTDFVYRPRRPEELDSERGGGVIFSQAAHQIDVVRRLVGEPVQTVRAVTGNWDAMRRGDGAYSAMLLFNEGCVASLTYSGYGHFDSDELMGWISELGVPKDPARYGEARRTLAALDPAGEAHAKLARTYGATQNSHGATPPLHHEHFGFVLVSGELGDLKLSPDSVTIYGNHIRETVAISPPRFPRSEVIEALVSAVFGERPPIHDGRWGLETMACCKALVDSSREHRDISPRTIIEQIQEPVAG